MYELPGLHTRRHMQILRLSCTNPNENGGAALPLSFAAEVVSLNQTASILRGGELRKWLHHSLSALPIKVKYCQP